MKDNMELVFQDRTLFGVIHQPGMAGDHAPIGQLLAGDNEDAGQLAS